MEKQLPRAAVSFTAAASSSSTPARKCLVFDRRYGWVFDEWKEPSEEALIGGRGMFCIVPLAKEVFRKASESINFVGSATLNVIERPELLSPKAAQAALSGQMHKIASSLKNTKLLLTTPKRIDDGKELTSCSLDMPEENSGRSKTE